MYRIALIMLAFTLLSLKSFKFKTQRINTPFRQHSSIVDKFINVKAANDIILNGTVVERLGDRLLVNSLSLGTIQCFQQANLTNLHTNIVVGDQVLFKIDKVLENTLQSIGTVVDIQDRMNVIERPAPRSIGRHKIIMKTIASNIDQVVIVTAAKPVVPLYTIDQLIVAAIAQSIPNIVIVINKIDEPNGELLESKFEHYKNLGYRIIKTSTKTSVGITELEDTLSNRTSILIGQSGVGKSSLVNILLPEINAKVGDLVSRVEMGAHTTSNAKLYYMKNGGRIIDSPGIREFALSHYDLDTIRSGFVEINEISIHCKFRNCAHDNKAKGCAVTKAVKDGTINPERLMNYRKFITDEK